MKSAYILHGCCDREEYDSPDYPSPSNFHWIPWLQKQLVMKGYNCQTPEMPMPYNASFPAWKRRFDIYPVDTATSLVGHSCGGGFLLRWLSESDVSIDKLILVSPWLDPKKLHGDFLTCVLNPALHDRVNKLHVFYSTDEDVEGVKETVDLVMAAYPKSRLHTYHDKGHFTLNDMKSAEFPQLLHLLEPA